MLKFVFRDNDIRVWSTTFSQKDTVDSSQNILFLTSAAVSTDIKHTHTHTHTHTQTHTNTDNPGYNILRLF